MTVTALRTARETLAALAPHHAMHSVADWVATDWTVSIGCSCGQKFSITQALAIRAGLDLDMVKSGLRNAPKRPS